MRPFAYTFVARAGQWQSPPCSKQREASELATKELQHGLEGCSSVDIMLVTGNTEYRVEVVQRDRIHAVIYQAFHRYPALSSYPIEGSNLDEVLERGRIASRIPRTEKVDIYLCVAGARYLINSLTGPE
jgi:hypothetical protein